jgi:hypothetical protein
VLSIERNEAVSHCCSGIGMGTFLKRAIRCPLVTSYNQKEREL